MNSPTISPKSATIKDVARLAGVSVMTVSRILDGQRQNSAHREAVLQAAQELGYAPDPHAQRLVRGRSLDLVGLFSSHLDLGVATRQLQMVQILLAERGFRVPLSLLGGRDSAAYQHEALADLRRQKPLAIVCFDPLGEAGLAELERFQDEGGIVVLSEEYPSPLACDQVIFDLEFNIESCVAHLFEQGHRKIGICAHGTFADGDRKVSAFQMELQKRGLEFRPDWVFSSFTAPGAQEFLSDIETDRVLFRGLYEEAGVVHARHLASLPKNDRPTALFLINDQAGAAFINEARRLGLDIPRDVSLVSHDDLPAAASAAVPLSSTSYPVETIAREVVELLLSRLVNRAPSQPRQIVVRGALASRQSVAEPPL